jgi:hypothetical protein
MISASSATRVPAWQSVSSGVGVKAPIRVEFGAVRVRQRRERGVVGVTATAAFGCATCILANRILARCGQWKKYK